MSYASRIIESSTTFVRAVDGAVGGKGSAKGCTSKWAWGVEELNLGTCPLQYGNFMMFKQRETN